MLCDFSVLVVVCLYYVNGFFFFFQAEDGIRDAQESRGLGDVYKRQSLTRLNCTFRLSSVGLRVA